MNENIIKGLGVSKGKIKGRVRIINSSEDHSDFEQGEILVTTLTDPTMTGLMIKSSGVICEIGGMTSHPSIISRELGIPCVVGVNDAKKFLKTGDLIEICGVKGHIKKLD